MLDIVKSLKENSWVFRWKSDSKCVIAHRAEGRKQPVCEMLFPSGKDELGSAITEFLNKSPKQFPIDANIDWVLLRKQKLSLTKLLDNQRARLVHADDLSGILHLIDNIQDCAVESGKWTEKEVFG